MIAKMKDRKAVVFMFLVGIVLSAWLGVQYATGTDLFCSVLFPGTCNQGGRGCDDPNWRASSCWIICSVFYFHCEWPPKN